MFHEGDTASTFYIILGGSCSVLVSSLRMDGKTELKQISVLRRGECFGELALISNQLRIASILCREDSHFATLSRDDYMRILGKAQDRQIQLKVEILHNLTIFKKWSKTALQRLSYFFKIRHFKRKQTVFSAGLEVTEVSIVKEGEFQLAKEVQLDQIQITSPKPGKPTHCSVDVTLISVGEVLGSEDLFNKLPHSYTCSCHSTTGELMVISKKDFYQTMCTEETVNYLNCVNKIKEAYRKKRIATAVKVEREKRTVFLTPQHTGRDDSFAREGLRLESAKFSGETSIRSSQFLSPKSLNATIQHIRTSSAITQQLTQSLEQSGMKSGHHPKTKSWSAVFLSKYSLNGSPKQFAERPKPIKIVNYHTHSLRELKSKRFQGFINERGSSSRIHTMNDSTLRLKLQ